MLTLDAIKAMLLGVGRNGRVDGVPLDVFHKMLFELNGRGAKGDGLGFESFVLTLGENMGTLVVAIIMALWL